MWLYPRTAALARDEHGRLVAPPVRTRACRPDRVHDGPAGARLQRGSTAKVSSWQRGTAKHFFASYFGTPRWFARLPERFNCCDKSILPSRACSRAPSSATAACARGRAGEAAGHTPRAHISFTGQAASNRTNRRCGMLRPAGQRTRSDCSGRRSAVEVHVSWTNAPETQKRALRHWHHNYEHVLKMLELPTVSQRKEKAATVAARTSLPRRAR